MSDHHLKIAREFIEDRDFASARKVLSKIPNHPTAQKWLAKIDELEQRNTTPRPIELPMQLEVIMRKHLAEGEVVLWYEQPEPVTYARYLYPNSSKAVFIISGIIMLCTQFFFLSRGGISPASSLQVLTAMLFIAAPFYWDFIGQQRATTVHYILTNRQAFIVEKLKVKPMPPVHPSKISVVTGHNGFKSVIFRKRSTLERFFVNSMPIGFLGIVRAEDVKQIILKYWT